MSDLEKQLMRDGAGDRVAEITSILSRCSSELLLLFKTKYVIFLCMFVFVIVFMCLCVRCESVRDGANDCVSWECVNVCACACGVCMCGPLFLWFSHACLVFAVYMFAQ